MEECTNGPKKSWAATAVDVESTQARSLTGDELPGDISDLVAYYGHAIGSHSFDRPYARRSKLFFE